MPPRVWVSSIKFSDGSALDLGLDDVILIVGPNNSGKSAALRAVREKVADSSRQSPVVLSLVLGRSGTAGDVVEWLSRISRINIDSSPANPIYQLFGVSVHKSNAEAWWSQPHLSELSRFFCHLLTADERLRAANPAPAIALLRVPPSHPIHFLQKDDALEAHLSSQFRKAFGLDLVVHRNAGNEVPLYTGERPQPAPGQDRLSHDYIAKIERLPALQNQGDGMRSFAGVLLETSVGSESILLIDEPEAFLHPPQARLLGQMLVREKPSQRQLFLATHSGDFLRGVLDGNSANVRVVRIRREGGINRITQLESTRIQALWSDPLLRYSNVLDGLFHEAVVVTESDADARFFAAIGDVLSDGNVPDLHKPDVMFTHGGGKARLPLIVRSLRLLGVPVKAVADFDILNDERPLRDLVEAAGGTWEDFEADWKAVKNAIDSKKPELSSNEVRKEVEAILAAVQDQYFPAASKRLIEQVLRRASPWAHARTLGKAFVPSGTPTQTCDRLLARLHDHGICVVEVGELEGFVRSVGGHGPAWVNEVLQKDLRNDPELETARLFVRGLFAAPELTKGAAQPDVAAGGAPPRS